MSKFIKRLSAVMSGVAFTPIITAYAASGLPPISPDVSADDFDDLSIGTVAGFIIGLTMWVLRLAGILCLIWGIYSTVTCRKDGDADGINMGTVKIIIGAVLLGLPTILKALNIIK